LISSHHIDEGTDGKLFFNFKSAPFSLGFVTLLLLFSTFSIPEGVGIGIVFVLLLPPIFNARSFGTTFPRDCNLARAAEAPQPRLMGREGEGLAASSSLRSFAA
jgi:hypothetical protein